MNNHAELRAALEAGPTPGPWTMDGTGTRALVRGADLTIVAVRHRLSGQAHEANARLIAAANPAVIRALLAERDALLDQHHRDSKELRRLCAQRDAARKVSKEAGAVIAALKAEKDALREALEMMVKVGEMNGVGRAYAMKVARTALAQGQEEA